MYLGTNEPALEIARSIRNEEIRSARYYREARAAKRAARKRSRTSSLSDSAIHRSG